MELGTAPQSSILVEFMCSLAVLGGICQRFPTEMAGVVQRTAGLGK